VLICLPKLNVHYFAVSAQSLFLSMSVFLSPFAYVNYKQKYVKINTLSLYLAHNTHTNQPKATTVIQVLA
jgi:hypothetical protein